MVLFGWEFDLFGELEVVAHTKKRIVLHISSQFQMTELFTMTGWCAVEFNGDVELKTCGGCVNVLRKKLCGGDVVMAGVVLRR